MAVQFKKTKSTIPPVDPSCVDLKHSALLAQLLLEEVDLESTSELTSPVGKPGDAAYAHTDTGEPVARSPGTLARPASNNMPLSEHDTQELRRLLYLRAEGIERQERLQWLRQTVVYSLHYGQQCSPEGRWFCTCRNC